VLNPNNSSNNSSNKNKNKNKNKEWDPQQKAANKEPSLQDEPPSAKDPKSRGPFHLSP